MRIADVLRGKGDAVVTIAPDADVTALLELLAEHQIGAVVVAEDGADGFVGIVSERDVVRRMREQGAAVLSAPVSSLMTTEVYTCSPSDHLEQMARTMTERRFRHLPVVQDGRMVGVVSIGDIVKHRLDELQAENEQLTGYIHQ